MRSPRNNRGKHLKIRHLKHLLSFILNQNHAYILYDISRVHLRMVCVIPVRFLETIRQILILLLIQAFHFIPPVELVVNVHHREKQSVVFHSLVDLECVVIVWYEVLIEILKLTDVFAKNCLLCEHQNLFLQEILNYLLGFLDSVLLSYILEHFNRIVLL